MALLVVFILLALVFGIGGLIKGLFWALVIAAALIAVSGFTGYKHVSRR